MEEYPHLPEYARLFISHLQIKNRKKSTIKRYYYDLLDFFAWIRVVRKSDDKNVIQTLDSSLLNDYFLFLSEQREYSTATTKRVLTVIKSLLQFLQSNGTIGRNPFQDMEQILKSDNHFRTDDFISDEEFQALYQTLSSLEGLTEKQQKFRHLLIKRNETIVSLLYEYGITLKELTSIKMEDVHLSQRKLRIQNNNEYRAVALHESTCLLMSSYLDNIPAAIRPRNFSSDHFFIAFDYQRGTFRFDYSHYEPKSLTVIAVQKMLRQEIKRAGLRPGISAQHLRRSAILNALQEGKSDDDVLLQFGLRSQLTVQRYAAFLKEDNAV
jgi:site-specific recombinase XerD